ncbi:hypothetical protein Tel_03680 [Candidatus Tenderia electrophaga]|jgi:hypothetical protein|uniref:Inner membrane protein n=1 Tax=Candidatus Tenderia electrophaga TaxID=1748243 RepID=A0A0S2TAZ2_9GAMM|nr:hypothetical protein Tel_03680 [Candidatus Tenderia electrophaga]
MKPVLLCIGVCCVGLGFVGIFLPLLPTVPFVLVAAACFAKSSQRLHQWLLASRHFGALIHHWQTTRSIPKRAKRAALALLIASGALSVYLMDSLLLKLLVASFLLIPAIILLRLPSSPAADCH